MHSSSSDLSLCANRRTAAGFPRVGGRAPTVSRVIAFRLSRVLWLWCDGEMQRGDVDRWLADYVEAWRTYERARIAALFSADAEYRYHPYDEPLRGRDAIVRAWL